MKNNYLKTMILSIALASGAYLQAQEKTNDISKQTEVGPSTSVTVSGSIKLVDNKGTIKYLQAANGLTILTNANNSGDRNTTTWQLGGQLIDDTYIDVSGKTFGLDGINVTTVDASTDATSGTTHGVGSGWTLLVRNEATGAIEKLLATDMIQSGTTSNTIPNTYTAGNNHNITATGITLTASQIWVYRNGARLNPGTDYTVATNLVTLTPGSGNNAKYPLYENDNIQIQWIK